MGPGGAGRVGSLAAAPEAGSRRRHDVDALRALAVFFGVLYHCARVFGVESWHIRNAETSAALDLLARVSSLFRMPLLFVLAGVGTYFALGRRSAGAYASERVKRLVVPLVFGVLVIVPPQVYIERLHSGQTAGQSFADFYLSVFTTGWYPTGNLSLHHLWFLRDLFALSLLALPLLAFARGPQGAALLAAVGRLAQRRPWLVVVVPMVLLGVIELAWRDRVPGANLLHYLVLFLCGYAIVANPAVEDAVRRVWRPALTAVAVLVALRFAVQGSTAPPPDWQLLLRGGDVLLEWLGMLALIGLGDRYLRRPIPRLRTAAEVAYPFYIWHQLVIVALAYPVVRLNMAVAPKFLLLTSTSFAATLMLSHAVLLTAPTRLLFGLKPATGRKQVPLPAEPSLAAPVAQPAQIG